jgi:hypothetical protein
MGSASGSQEEPVKRGKKRPHCRFALPKTRDLDPSSYLPNSFYRESGNRLSATSTPKLYCSRPPRRGQKPCSVASWSDFSSPSVLCKTPSRRSVLRNPLPRRRRGGAAGGVVQGGVHRAREPPAGVPHEGDPYPGIATICPSDTCALLAPYRRGADTGYCPPRRRLVEGLLSSCCQSGKVGCSIS